MWMGSSNMAYPSGVARSPPDGFNDTNMFDILLRYGFWYHRQHGNHALVFDLRDYAPPGR